MQTGSIPRWDAFISYAREDSVVAHELADRLSISGLRVWCDKFVLTIGDKLLEMISEGLSFSQFGVVLLSPDFFAKEWTRLELDALVQKEFGGSKVVLPVWHRVSYEEVRAFSPILAGRLAARTDAGIEKCAADILAAVKRSPSSLVEHTVKSSESVCNEDRVEQLLQEFASATDPESYDLDRKRVLDATVHTLQIYSTRSWNDFGSLDELCDNYVEALGIQGVSGMPLIVSWLKELESDHWWKEHVHLQHYPPMRDEESVPEWMLRDAFRNRDLITLLWILSKAFVRGKITARRNRLISQIKAQKPQVQTPIWKSWTQSIAGETGDYDKVVANPEEAFDIQYSKGDIFRQYRKS